MFILIIKTNKKFSPCTLRKTQFAIMRGSFFLQELSVVVKRSCEWSCEHSGDLIHQPVIRTRLCQIDSGFWFD
jgi:hypothetical protein